MALPLYQLQITRTGDFVAEYLKEKKLILFGESAPPDIADYCALHNSGELTDRLLPGQKVEINALSYRITAVGSVATKNLIQLGHITLNFDGAINAELPGMIHLSGPLLETIHPGDQISIYHN